MLIRVGLQAFGQNESYRLKNYISINFENTHPSLKRILCMWIDTVRVTIYTFVTLEKHHSNCRINHISLIFFFFVWRLKF